MRTIWIAAFLCCSIIPAYSTETLKPLGVTDQSVRNASDVILNKMLKALDENKPADYISWFTPDLRSSLVNGGFEALQENYKKDYGSLSPAVYLGFINGTEGTRVLYKVYSEKHKNERQITMEFSNYVQVNDQTGQTTTRTYLTNFILE